MTADILIYNPTAASRERVTGRVELSGLAGRTVGVIDNVKPNFDVLAKHLTGVLRERYGVAGVVYKAKGGPTMPAPEAFYEELARSCDLVITGSGD